MARRVRTHVAELDEAGNVHDAPPPYAFEDNSPQKLFGIPPTELKIWPQTPSNNQLSPNGPSLRGRGRPPVDLDGSALRTIIRLFVYTSVSFERITKAVKASDGPGRQWLIEFFQKVTDVVPNTGQSLSTLRLRNNVQMKGDTATHRHAEETSLPVHCAGCELAGLEHTRLCTERLPKSRDTAIQNPGPGHGDLDENPEEPGPSKSKTPQQPTSSREPAQSPPKKPIIVRPTRIVDELDGKKGGPNHHLGRCVSVTKHPIASRGSSMFSNCNLQTGETEFIRHYASFDTREPEPGGVRGVEGDLTPSPSTLHSQSRDTPLVLGLIHHNRMEDEKDDKVSTRLNEAFSGKDDDAIKFLVNEADDLGVTPLHIATALGLRKTCRILMACGADIGARTFEDTCINHFAWQNEREAGAHDLKLFYRILHCRQYVKRGIPPPVPTRNGLKRRMSEQSSKKPRSDDLLEHKAPRRGYTHFPAVTPSPVPQVPLPPLVEDGFNTTAASVQPGVMFTTFFTDSPAASLHTHPSTTDFRDLMNCSILPRKAAFGSTIYPPANNHRNLHSAIASSGTRSIATPIRQRNIAIIGGQSMQNTENVGCSHGSTDTLPLLPEEQLRGASVTDSFDFGTQYTDPLPAASAYSSTTEQPAFLDRSEHASSYSVPHQPYPIQHIPRQTIHFQPHPLVSHDSSRNAFSSIGNEVPDFAVNLDGGSVYLHCQHGHPRDFQNSYCRLGCPPLKRLA